MMKKNTALKVHRTGWWARSPIGAYPSVSSSPLSPLHTNKEGGSRCGLLVSKNSFGCDAIFIPMLVANREVDWPPSAPHIITGAPTQKNKKKTPFFNRQQ